jgi:hypothetical protein
MGALSAVTLVLGVLREFVIARDLQASGAADLFFRGLAVVGAARYFSMALFRARWIPIGAGVDALDLLRGERGSVALIVVIAIGGLGLMLPAEAWTGATAWVFVFGAAVAVLGSAVRALAERAGLERRGFALEWALPLGTIVGAVFIRRGALGPAVGLAGGLTLGLALLAPIVVGAARRSSAATSAGPSSPQAIRWLLLDTLSYVNLGLLDAGMSRALFDEGGFALLNYAYMFVNAGLAVPMAAATVVSLRIASRGDEASRAKLRAWALVAGVVVGGCIALVYATLSWAPVAELVDRAAGWSFSEAIRPIVLYALPFGALRLTNTVGRQFLVAHDPKALVPYDLVGLVGRTAVLVVGAATIGVLASPIALTFAELVQLPAWMRRRPAPADAS